MTFHSERFTGTRRGITWRLNDLVVWFEHVYHDHHHHKALCLGRRIKKDEESAANQRLSNKPKSCVNISNDNPCRKQCNITDRIHRGRYCFQLQVRTYLWWKCNRLTADCRRASVHRKTNVQKNKTATVSVDGRGIRNEGPRRGESLLSREQAVKYKRFACFLVKCCHSDDWPSGKWTVTGMKLIYLVPNHLCSQPALICRSRGNSPLTVSWVKC